jgi:hypothetical protein
MAKPGKVKSENAVADYGQDAPVAAPAEASIADAPIVSVAEDVMTTAAEPAPEPTPQPSAEVVEVLSATPLAIIEEAVESAKDTFSASFQFDGSLWASRSVELWAENAAAFFAFAEQIAKARSFEDVIELQKRFATERFEAFVRQSKELTDFAKDLTTISVAPLCDARKKAA